MAAIANVVINDGLATPVAHTFSPARTSADYALFEDRVSGIYVGYNKLALNLKRPVAGNKGTQRALKLMVRIETPKLETLGNSDAGFTPPPTVAHRPMVEMVFTLPERCTKQDRSDLLAYAKNALANAQVALSVTDYELPY